MKKYFEMTYNFSFTVELDENDLAAVGENDYAYACDLLVREIKSRLDNEKQLQEDLELVIISTEE